MIWSKSMIKQIKFFIVVVMLLLGGGIDAAAELSDSLIALCGGKIVTVTRGVIENGTILVVNGRIEKIGQNIQIPPTATKIDVSGLTVYPGFINGCTDLGTTELQSFDQDHRETGEPLMPQLHIIDSLNPDNPFICLARQYGVTSVILAPAEGNILSGQAAFIDLYGKTAEDMVVRFPIAMCGSVGELPKLFHEKQETYPMTRMGQAAMLRQIFEDAAYSLQETKTTDKKRKKSIKLKQDKLMALKPVLCGEMPLMIRANRLDDMLTMLRIAEEYKIKLIFSHGTDAYRLADRLKTLQIPLIIAPYVSFWQQQETLQANPRHLLILAEKNIRFAFQTGASKNGFNLLNEARQAISAGLSEESALLALTMHPAMIAGAEQSHGSLEPGKIANIAIYSGNVFAPASQLKMLFIKGVQVI
jgi:imidazolonepropionase-like amidohydrolase